MESFELREYDAVIGRMLIVDPARQYFSPYVAMGNNPINLVDPDGAVSGPALGVVTGSGWAYVAGSAAAAIETGGMIGAAAYIGWEVGQQIGNNVDYLSYQMGRGLVGLGLFEADEAFPAWAVNMDGEVLSFDDIKDIITTNLAELSQSEFRIALGVDEYLPEFAKEVKAIPYSVWAKGLSTKIEVYRAGIIFLGMLPNTTFHVNLASPRGRIDNPINIKLKGNSFTTMEYLTTKGMFPHKTFTYNRKFN